MDIRIENVIIRTFKKMRESFERGESLSTMELAGLFVNFVYHEYGSHTGLDTRKINIYKTETGIWNICFNEQLTSYNPSICHVILDALSGIEPSQYYSMWLRASWEDPKTSSWEHPVIRNTFKDYKGIISRET